MGKFFILSSCNISLFLQVQADEVRRRPGQGTGRRSRARARDPPRPRARPHHLRRDGALQDAGRHQRQARADGSAHELTVFKRVRFMCIETGSKICEIYASLFHPY